MRGTAEKEETMRMRSTTAALAFASLCLSLPAVSSAETWEKAGAIFENRCIMCHQAANRSAGLRLDTHEGVLAGSEFGKVVVKGKPQESELINRVRGVSTPRMPLGGPDLPEEEIKTLEEWIAAGAPGPK